MTDFLKYDMADLWASSGDKVAPDSAKIAAGWGVEVVPRQWWNWFENRQDNNIAYILQKGIPEWDAFTEYQINKSYVQRNGVVYKAVATNTNVDPALLTDWIRAFNEYTIANEALGTITPAADRLPYFNGASTATYTTLTSFARSFLDDVDAAAVRTTLGAQTLNTNLTALSSTTGATNMLPYYNAATTMTTTSLTAFGRSLIDDADATAGRTTLDLITQSTADDTTANRVMKTGAFGLGTGVVTTATLLSTFSQYTPTGFYRCTNTTTGAPFATAVTAAVNAISVGATVTIYSVTRYDTRQTWVASYVNGVLSAWTESSSIDSPVFTGTPRVPQAALGDDSTQIANTAFVFDELAKYGLAPVSTSLGAGVDLNNLRTPGFYGQATSAQATLVLNYPIALAGTLLINNAGTTETSQMYVVFNTGETYIRSYYNGTWYAWRKMFDTVNTTAVGQSVMTASTTAAARTAIALGNVDNTSDANKPVSTAQQTALNLKVNNADIIDNLTTVDATKPLSAKQGKTLKDLVDTVTGTAFATYEFVATGGQTAFSGVDSKGLTLSYTVGQTMVLLNGQMLQVTTDYTASTGTSVTLVVAATAGDLLQIIAFGAFAVANTYSQAQADARFVQPGQYGIGIPTVSTETNLNNYTSGGSYIIPATGVTNLPTSWGQGRATLEVDGGASAYISQSIKRNGFSALRWYNGSTWEPWYWEINQNNIIGTVSQTAGVPTGAVIEEGSNANGLYTKFADGTLICYMREFPTDQALNTAYGALFQGTRVWTFPVAFFSAPAVTCGSFRWGSGASWGTLAATPGTTTVTLRGIDNVTRATGTSVDIEAIAIGRWF